MASSFRYKYVQNSTAGALTRANFPVVNDGDDKQEKFIRHVLSRNDIGVGAGQIGNAGGLILDVIPANYNVLWFDVTTFRPTAGGGINRYNCLDNQVVSVTFDDPDYVVESYEVAFWVAADNTLRVQDRGIANPTAILQFGDVLIGRLVIGSAQDSRDYMNYVVP